MLMGNLGAGKSTLGRLFEAEGWCRIVIDDFRPPSLKGGAIDFEQEYLARNALLAAIHAAKGDIVYETTTANQVHPKVLKAIETKRVQVTRVRLLVSEVESLKRVSQRGENVHYTKTHAESYGYIERKLNADWADLVFDSERMGVEEIFGDLRGLFET
jgi:dephospho-CoA kinase